MIEPVFFPHISVEDNIKLFLKIHRKEFFLENSEAILKLVGLWDARKRKPVHFSFGMKQRTALALALIMKPKFVLLDEPFVGLDPIGVKNLLAILKEWAANHETAMIISSHQLAELQDLCNRYLFIDNGVVTKQELSHKGSLIVELHEETTEITSSKIDELLTSFSLTKVANKIKLPSNLDNTSLNTIIKVLAEEGAIKTILSHKDSLESFFKED